MKNIYNVFFTITVLFLISCNKGDKRLEISFDFPINSTKLLEVYNLSSQKEIFNDTLKNNFFALDSMKFGLYLFTLSWERELISPSEFRRLTRFGDNQNLNYTIRKVIFVDPNTNTKVRIYTNEANHQQALEDIICSSKEYFSPSSEVLQGDEAVLYEEYENIVNSGKKQFFVERDSLYNLMYKFNDLNDFKNSKAINHKIKILWDSVVMPRSLAQEIEFLIKYSDRLIVPFILHEKVFNTTSWLNYHSVIKQLPDKFKKMEFIRKLDRFEP